MKVWRSFMLVFWVTVIAVCTAFFIQYQALRTTVLDREKSKQWLAESSTYEKLRDEVIVDQVKLAVDEKLPSNALIDKPLIRSVVGEVFPKTELINRTEPIVDNTYAWLDSKEPRLTFEVPLADKQSQFYRSLEVKLGNKIDSLRDCGDYRYPPEEALLSDLCIPTYVTAGEATQAAMGYIRASDFPFGDAITEESFTLPAESLTTLRRLPTYLNYLWVLNLVVLAVVTFAITRLIWKRRSVGVVAIGAGLALGGILAWLFTPTLASIELQNTSGIGLVIASAINTLIPKLVSAATLYAFYSIIIGGLLVGVTMAWRWQRGKRHVSDK